MRGAAVREVLQLLLETLAILLIAVGLGLVVAQWSQGAGFTTAGCVLLLAAWLGSRS
jgi:hypothetical protein